MQQLSINIVEEVVNHHNYQNFAPPNTRHHPLQRPTKTRKPAPLVPITARLGVLHTLLDDILDPLPINRNNHVHLTKILLGGRKSLLVSVDVAVIWARVRSIHVEVETGGVGDYRGVEHDCCGGLVPPR